MNKYEELEQKAVEKTGKKKSKMKVSGKSVFVLSRLSRKK